MANERREGEKVRPGSQVEEGFKMERVISCVKIG